jgi:pimeloyl-ACP methyl ester carboxylesterase
MYNCVRNAHSPRNPASYREHVHSRRLAETSSSTTPALGLKAAFLAAGLLLGTAASALECGNFEFPKCSGPDAQYAEGFDPQTGFGGFGGGECTASRTPVIFIHGNGDRAINWDSPVVGTIEGYVPPPRSVYEEMKEQGYNDCELFGVTYLSIAEQQSAELNYHRPDKYQIINNFIRAVQAYTGKAQVDIVDHSLGVSTTLAALKYGDSWNSVRRFVNIAGAIRGLHSCLYVGYANVLVPTCGAQNAFDPYIFGFYPNTNVAFGYNRWTGAGSEYSLRSVPRYHPEVSFYTLHAGKNDEIHCSTVQGGTDCVKGALFEAAPNVRTQLNLGAGSTASRLDLDFSDRSPWNVMGGDTDGVGHFKVKNNSGPILAKLLNSDCTGLECKGDYAGGPVRVEGSTATIASRRARAVTP